MSELETWNGSWRGWHLEKGEHPLLRHETALSGEYVIDLLELNTSAEVLDTIIQLHGRAGFQDWDEILVGLIRALDGIFHYQANLCPGGRSKRLSKSKIHALIDAAREPQDDHTSGR
jgi:hypothetical protein